MIKFLGKISNLEIKDIWRSRKGYFIISLTNGYFLISKTKENFGYLTSKSKSSSILIHITKLFFSGETFWFDIHGDLDKADTQRKFMWDFSISMVVQGNVYNVFNLELYPSN